MFIDILFHFLVFYLHFSNFSNLHILISMIIYLTVEFADI